MKKILKFSIGIVGVTALSFGFSQVLAEGQTNVGDGDKYRVVKVKEQVALENKTNKTDEGRDLRVIISAEEQNIVENSSALSGFVSKENGQGFYFTRDK
ncbi:hypothetical protein [Halobacillus sp. Nhm2S1]|uniref:hypothetical protein n=1 Tax=Halobacillus sp. Nhm2S1 TaxID=2866716 RepID=UPI001C734136|nr:hypothetical protein [Halobacillus sp. Nhm2S1]MBX0359545.1 hypothetical protein [Halobacillus sp. Nhm2S1]